VGSVVNVSVAPPEPPHAIGVTVDPGGTPVMLRPSETFIKPVFVTLNVNDTAVPAGAVCGGLTVTVTLARSTVTVIGTV
jgi:hypothetical protein